MAKSKTKEIDMRSNCFAAAVFTDKELVLLKKGIDSLEINVKKSENEENQNLLLPIDELRRKLVELIKVANPKIAESPKL